MRDPGEFKLDGEEFGSMSHWGSPDGPLGVDINMDRLNPAEARKLAAWLLKAADYVTAHNRKRKKSANDES